MLNDDSPDRELSDLVESLQKMKAVVERDEGKDEEPKEDATAAPLAAPPSEAAAAETEPPEQPAPVAGPTVPEAVAYAQREVDALRQRQAAIQEQIETKTKEIGQLRETLLVLAGAVQGLEHMHKFMTASP